MAHVHRTVLPGFRHRSQVGHDAHLRRRVLASQAPRRPRHAVADVDRLRHHAGLRRRPSLLQRARRPYRRPELEADDGQRHAAGRRRVLYCFFHS